MALIDEIVAKVAALPIQGDGSLILDSDAFTGVDFAPLLFTQVLNTNSLTIAGATKSTPTGSATLTGTATVFSYSDLGVTITFSAVDDQVTIAVDGTFAPGKSVSLPIVTWISIANIGITADIAQPFNLVTFTFHAAIILDGDSAPTVPITITPQGASGWHLTVDEGVSQGVSGAQLVTLLGGNSLTSFLPQDLVNLLAGFELNGITTDFDLTAKTISNFTISITVTNGWDILPNFSLAPGLTISFLATDLNDASSRTLVGAVKSTFLVAGVPVPIFVQGQTGPSAGVAWSIGLDPESTGVTLPSLSNLFDLSNDPNFKNSLPSGLSTLPGINVFKLQVDFTTGPTALQSIAFGAQTTSPWDVIDGFLTIDALSFEMDLLNLSDSANRQIGVNLASRLLILNTVFLYFTIAKDPASPDWVLAGGLPKGISLNFTDLVAKLLSSYVTIPANAPQIVLDQADITVIPGTSMSFTAGSNTPWTLIAGKLTLDSFTLTFNYASGTPNSTFTGSLDTQITIANVPIQISAQLSTGTGGWQFEGKTLPNTKINVLDLINDLGSVFGVQAPTAISNFSLQDIDLKMVSSTDASQPGASSFHFSCAADVTLAGSALHASVIIDLTRATSGGYDKDFTGTLSITTASGTTEDFILRFVDNAQGSQLTGTWSDPNNPLEFSDIANAFGWKDMPTVPPDLDLSLISATLTYNFTSGNLIFAAQSKNYGSFVFAAISVGGTYQYDFMLSVDQSFSLSNLPLVGKQLAAIENIEVGDIQILLCSVIPTAAVITTINNLITALNTQGPTQYPLFPTTPLTGTFVLQAQLTFGSQSVPLDLQLGGGSSSQAALPAPNALVANAAAAGALAIASPRGAVATSSSTPTTKWFNVQKSFGPVSFQRIGAMYQSDQQVLWFQLDASLAFGPITLDLVGLGLGSPLTSFEPQFSLQGLGISYSAPPLTIAGSLTNLAPPGADYIAFEGGVTIGTGEFTVMAFGFYGNQGGFNSMFIFGDIAYDFGGPPAFFVTGIALGFGYNSNLRIPTIDEVTAFPFVEVLPTSMVPNTGVFGANPTPQTVLNVIMNTSPAWVSPQQGSLWFAAGITFTSFELVNSQALILVQVGPELIIALVGISRAQFPQGAGSEVPVYAYIELDLLVEFAPSQGIFSVQAVLAKSSFLLDKACVLTGGFAFFVWYGPNPHAGDFVLTLGGYNPGFTPPSYYPKVPEVGFHWSLDSSISITGGAYFAFTPSVLMVGGELNATYQSGNLKAWFDAHADIIVQWNPFWFDAAFGISIGASYKVDLWFTSFTVTAELGCNLEVWGPPTGGTVGVDWYIISFSIPFGASKNSSKPVINQWSQVQAMLPNSGTATAPNVITLSPASGLTPTATSPANSGNGAARALAAADVPATPAAWIVRGSQFSFNTSSSIPASSATVGSAHAINGSQFNVAPLGWTDMSAAHAITIVSNSANIDVSSAFSVSPSFGNVPSQLWGSQSSSTPDSSAQLVPNQLVGLSVVVNPPEIGGSAGAVNVAVNLANINLNIAGALIGIAASANPEGDVAVNSLTTLAVMVDPNSGIASTATTTARNAIFTALGTLQYGPGTKNDPLTNFASQAGGSFSAVPLLVA